MISQVNYFINQLKIFNNQYFLNRLQVSGKKY